MPSPLSRKIVTMANMDDQGFVEYPRGAGSNFLGGGGGVSFSRIGDAVNLPTRNPVPYIVGSIPLIVITLFVYGFQFALPSLADLSDPASSVAVLLLIYPLTLIMVFLAFFNLAGMMRMGIRQLRGEPISAGMIWDLNGKGLSVLGAILMAGLATGAGMIFCIIPGYIVFGLLLLTFPLIVEEGMGTSEAMRTSWDLLKPFMWPATGMGFLLYLIQSFSPAFCGVGYAFGQALMALTIAYIYADVRGLKA
jgi:hypothetical protein